MKIWEPGVLLLGALLLGGGGFRAAGATTNLFGPSLLVMQENDLVVRTDRHYTQGLKFTFLGSEHSGPDERGKVHWTEGWSGWFPAFGMETVVASRYGVSLGQNIYTPTDISVPTLQVDDRPYAGFLYSELMVQRRGRTKSETPVLDHFQMTLGVMGPASLAEEAQNTVHRLRNFGLAMGWGNQLTVEPGVALKFGRMWRYSVGSPDGFSADLMPHVGLSLGNVGTYGAGGGQVRAGYRIPPDFGLRSVDAIVPAAGGKWEGQPVFGAYVFLGVEGRAVAYNAFLDGNLLHASHHVAKKPMVGDASFGLVVVFPYCDIAFTQIFRSKEFVGQNETDAFGSLALRIKW